MLAWEPTDKSILLIVHPNHVNKVATSVSSKALEQTRKPPPEERLEN
jgi:hypothetical protein